MIKPHKHLNLENNILTVSQDILDALISDKVLNMNEILQKIQTDNRLIFQSLSFLFLLGIISYIEEIDSIAIENEIK